MGELRTIVKLKLRASSLTEVVVSTSILMLVFAIALAVLSNVMMSTLQKDTRSLDTEIEKLIYQYRNQKLKAPLNYKEENYVISIEKIVYERVTYIDFSIKDEVKNKVKTKRIIAIDNDN